MTTVTLPKPTLVWRERSPVPPPSEEGYINDYSTRRTGADASSLIKYAMLMSLCTCVLVFVLSVLLGQEPAWPLHNISQYGGHVPAVYFFRVAGIVSGALVSQAGLLLRRRVRWALLFIPIGVCSAGSAAVSHYEDPTLHTAFAVLLFFGLATLEACAAHTAWTQRRHPLLFRSSGPPPWPRFWAAGAAYIYLSLAAIICAKAFGMHRQVTARLRLPRNRPRTTNQARPPPTVQDRLAMTAVLEWTGTLQVFFFWHQLSQMI